MSNALPIMNFPPGIILNPSTEKPSTIIHMVMTPLCVKCGRHISPSDGMFYYLESPYYGVIHKECAPYYDYPGRWPHSQYAQYYQSTSQFQQGFPQIK